MQGKTYVEEIVYMKSISDMYKSQDQEKLFDGSQQSKVKMKNYFKIRLATYNLLQEHVNQIY